MAERWADKAQGGIEATRGTAVAATRILPYDMSFTYNPNWRNLESARRGTGTLFNVYETAVGNVDVTGSLTDDSASYDDLQWHLSHGLKGDVTTTQLALGPPAANQWVFTADASADNLRSSTTEIFDQTQAFEYERTMYNSWTMTLAENSGLTFTADLIAKNETAAPITGGLAVVQREAITDTGWELWMDTTGAIGATAVANRLIGFDLTCNNNIHSKHFRTDAGGAAGAIGRGIREITGSITLEYTSAAQYNEFKAGTDQKIRLRKQGSVITGTERKRIVIDLYAQFSGRDRGDREGNIIETLNFWGKYNATAGTDLSITLVNKSTAIDTVTK